MEKPNAQRKRRQPSKPQPKADLPQEQPQVEVEAPKEPENKYAPKEKVGSPKIGRPVDYVTRVGLGKLRSITTYGNNDV